MDAALASWTSAISRLKSLITFVSVVMNHVPRIVPFLHRAGVTLAGKLTGAVVARIFDHQSWWISFRVVQAKEPTGKNLGFAYDV